MSIKGKRLSIKSLRGLAPLGVTLMVIAMVGGPAMMASAAPQDRAPQTPLVQQFEDVPDSHTFAEYINNLYLDGIISGYPCGGVGEPCGPGNLPYYRPGANVTRGQMSKFADLGRRNIADAIGDSLVISGTAFNTLVARTNSGGEAIDGFCLAAGACYAVQGEAEAAGNYGGVFGSDGYAGIYAEQDDANGAGVFARARGTDAYGLETRSDLYRSLYSGKIDGFFAAFVDMSANGPSAVGLRVEGSTTMGGSLTVAGGCTGCLLTGIVQNVGDSPLQVGDVVTIVGNSAAVVGESPVVTVRKASSAYDAGVAGVIGQVLYVPDEATRAAYQEQQRLLSEARAESDRLRSQAMASNAKADLSQVEFPEITISDDEGTMHVDATTDELAVGAYGGVVTSGSFSAIKVDASFGAIKAGDLLTTSPNPGYAMKVTDKAEATGAIIGKALGDLQSGTGTVPVMVTLK